MTSLNARATFRVDEFQRLRADCSLLLPPGRPAAARFLIGWHVIITQCFVTAIFNPMHPILLV